LGGGWFDVERGGLGGVGDRVVWGCSKPTPKKGRRGKKGGGGGGDESAEVKRIFVSNTLYTLTVPPIAPLGPRSPV